MWGIILVVVILVMFGGWAYESRAGRELRQSDGTRRARALNRPRRAPLQGRFVIGLLFPC